MDHVIFGYNEGSIFHINQHWSLQLATLSSHGSFCMERKWSLKKLDKNTNCEQVSFIPCFWYHWMFLFWVLGYVWKIVSSPKIDLSQILQWGSVLFFGGSVKSPDVTAVISNHHLLIFIHPFFSGKSLNLENVGIQIKTDCWWQPEIRRLLTSWGW